MFEFDKLNGFIYAGDFLFLAALATIIIKLKLENSSQGFSAKTQGVYGVVLCTRNIDLLFVEGSKVYLIYNIFKKITNISCIIYIVFKIKSTSKNNTTCNCNQDSFWVEALVLPCLIITAVFHYGSSPEEVLWSFSTYLEAVAMMPQLYLIHVRGKGDSYLPCYIALMAIYTFTDALAYCLNSFIYDNMPAVWPACKCLQLAIYIWYIIIPREAVLPVANCEERKRRTTFFMRQQSMLAQTLLNKSNSSNDLQVFSLTSPKTSASPSICSMSGVSSLDGGGTPIFIGDSPPPTPCLKFNIDLDSESIRLKPPIKLTTIKQLKNKGTLKIASLPSTPELSRKFNVSGTSLTNDCFTPINDFTKFNTALSQRAKRMKRLGASLPTTPVTLRKNEIPSKSSSSKPFFKSVSQIQSKHFQKRPKKVSDHHISLPTTPEPARKSELILRPALYASYRSLFHQPHTHRHCLKRPSLSTVKGSPALEKKLDQTTNFLQQFEGNTYFTKPERPPLPKNFKEDNETKFEVKLQKQSNNSIQEIDIESQIAPSNNILFDSTNKQKKPKRPPLPKLVLSTPETTNA